MSPLLHVGLANAAGAALLALVAVVVSRYCRRPALAHSLWLLALLKLVTPPLFPVNLAWLPAEETPPASKAIAQANAPAEATPPAQFFVLESMPALAPPS